jgi:hypothetical protein
MNFLSRSFSAVAFDGFFDTSISLLHPRRPYVADATARLTQDVGLSMNHPRRTGLLRAIGGPGCGGK